MPFAAFASPFTGAALQQRSRGLIAGPRCTMGSSVAPLINIKDTKSDQTSSVSVEMVPVPPNEAAASGIPGPAALQATLKKTRMPATLPSAAISPCPPGTSPADHYFPSSTRNEAPVIVLGADESLTVTYKAIESIVGGASSNAPESVAFWKEKTYKWVQPSENTATESTGHSEVLDTALYERYFPTDIRNRAPKIEMRPPAGNWDETAYLIVGSEYVEYDPALAAQLSVEQDSNETDIRASATVEKYFGGKDAFKAPDISIVPDSSVSFGFDTVPSPVEEATKLLVENGVTQE